MMKVWVNGEEKLIERARDVAGLVEELGLPVPAVLVEHNGVALRRDEWSGVTLAEGDKIEVLRIAAGG
jgi:sulfur carrier protein